MNPFRAKASHPPALSKTRAIFEESASRVYAQDETLKSPSFNQGTPLQVFDSAAAVPLPSFSEEEREAMKTMGGTDLASAIMSKIYQKQHSLQLTQPKVPTRSLSKARSFVGKGSHSVLGVYGDQSRLVDDSFSAKTEVPEFSPPSKSGSTYRATTPDKRVFGLFKQIESLSTEVKEMKRKMNHMQLSISEREAQIAELKISLGDERQKVCVFLEEWYHG